MKGQPDNPVTMGATAARPIWDGCPECGHRRKLIEQYKDAEHPELVLAVKNFRADLEKPCKVCAAHHAAVKAAVDAEREACAKIADNHSGTTDKRGDKPYMIADAIRNRRTP
jgi:predicted  nucleic acid-binding Zn-ribbon protein